MAERNRMEMDVTEAKRRFVDLVERVSTRQESVVIRHAGRPVAMLVPVREIGAHLAEVEGWLDDDDAFFRNIETVLARRDDPPRVV